MVIPIMEYIALKIVIIIVLVIVYCWIQRKRDSTETGATANSYVDPSVVQKYMPYRWNPPYGRATAYQVITNG